MKVTKSRPKGYGAARTRGSDAADRVGTELSSSERLRPASLCAGAKIPAHQDESEEYLYVLEAGRGDHDRRGGVDDRAGTAVFMPSIAALSYEDWPAKTVVVQVFANPRSAAKDKAWQPVTGP